MKMLQKEALIKTGIFGGKEINATIIALLLRVNHDMIEMNRTDITSGNKPIPILGYVHTNNSVEEASEVK
jgi:hypothetical protein